MNSRKVDKESCNKFSSATKTLSMNNKEDCAFSMETPRVTKAIDEAKMIENNVLEESKKTCDNNDEVVGLKSESECTVVHNCKSWLPCPEHPEFKTYNDIFSDDILHNYIKKKMQRSAEEEMQLKCDVCSMIFSTKGDLKRHITKHYEENPTVHIGDKDISHIDSRITKSATTISQHLLTHGLALITDVDSRAKLNGTTKIPCGVCSKQITDCYLRNHLLKHVGVWNVECAVCIESFEDAEGLMKHCTTHNDKRTCFVCGENVRIAEYDLQCHLLVHATAYPFNCLDCELTFFNTEELREHTLSFHKVNSNFCDICDKGFLNNFEYLRHVLTHAKNASYSCSDCSKLFDDHFDIFQEVSKMYVEPRFICDECHIAFSHYTHLRQHQVQHKLKFFSCEICSKTFNRKINLDKHELTHSKDYFKEEIDEDDTNGLVEFEEPFQKVMDTE